MFHLRLKQRFFTSLLILLSVCPVARVDAIEITDYLPDDTFGFLLIHNAQAANDGISRFMQLMNVKLPAPLSLLKFSTGLGDGVDQQKDLLIALLPGKAGTRAFRPMVLLPVVDYATFAASIQGDASGDICRVTISGEDVLLARKDEFALLMNVEHRATMEQLLSRQPQQAPSKQAQSKQALDDWLSKNDVAVVLLSSGLNALLDLGRRDLDSTEQQLAQNDDDADIGNLVSPLQQWSRLRPLLELTEGEVDAVAVGMAIDGQTNVRIGVRVILEENSNVAQLSFKNQEHHRFLAGYAAGPYVAAGEGNLAEGGSELLAKSIRRLQESYPELQGHQDLEHDDWNKAEQMVRELLEGIRAVSFVMRVGLEDEPVFSGFFALVEVDDSTQFLEASQRALKLDNELIERSTDEIKLFNETSKVTINGATGIEVVYDVAKASGDKNNQVWQAMLEKAFGSEGKLSVRLVAIDEKNLVVSTANEEKLVQFISDVQQGASGINVDPQLQTAFRLIDQNARWKAFVNPSGYVELFAKIVNTMVGQFGGGPQIPEFPQTPPIGLSFDLQNGQCELDIVLPVDTLKGMAKYIETAKRR